MQGIVLLVTFMVMALIGIAMAVVAGLIVDNFPTLSDNFSLLVFFGLTPVFLILAWLVAVRVTRPRDPAKA
jgi:hypothetical protein